VKLTPHSYPVPRLRSGGVINLVPPQKMIYNSMVKNVLIYGAETCSLYEDDRRRIDATEMDAIRP